MSRNTIYLLLGGNIPDRLYWIGQGVKAIAQHCGTITRRSPVYETAAWGREDQAPFLNLALEVSTSLTPAALLAETQAIEAALGRRRTEQWGSRTLDIDILFYGNRQINEPALKVPHPFLPVRRFALVPLCAIAPDFVHPVSGRTVAQLLAGCPDPLPVNIFQQPA